MKKTRLFSAVVVGLLAALLTLAACGSNKLDTESATGAMKHSISSEWATSQELGSSPLPNVESSYYVKADDDSFYVVVAVYDMNKAEPAAAAMTPDEQAKAEVDARKEATDMTFTQEELGSSSVSGAEVKTFKEEGTIGDYTLTEYVAYICNPELNIEATIRASDQEVLEDIVDSIEF
ncbi:MAG: hypothetical protein K6G78_06880 [bacterium]|nr:hypothetical protein [bacterium]